MLRLCLICSHTWLPILVIIRNCSFITKEDIIDFLGGDIPQSYIDDIMDEADINNDKKISYDEFLALWGEEIDEQMRKDREDVKERRHRRTDSGLSTSSVYSYASEGSFGEDEDLFDELANIPTSFKSGEIAKMLDVPDTPTRERRISATAAFKLEKERSMRDASKQESAASLWKNEKVQLDSS